MAHKGVCDRDVANPHDGLLARFDSHFVGEPTLATKCSCCDEVREQGRDSGGHPGRRLRSTSESREK